MSQYARRMRGIELKVIRDGLGLPVQWVASYLDVDPRTVRSWESGRDPVPEWVLSRIGVLEEQTDGIVHRLVEELREESSPVLLTYSTDKQYQEHAPDGQPWPARWHRQIAYRVKQRVPEVEIVEP